MELGKRYINCSEGMCKGHVVHYSTQPARHWEWTQCIMNLQGWVVIIFIMQYVSTSFICCVAQSRNYSVTLLWKKFINFRLQSKSFRLHINLYCYLFMFLGYGASCSHQQTNQKSSIGTVASGSLTSAISGSGRKFLCYCKCTL